MNDTSVESSFVTFEEILEEQQLMLDILPTGFDVLLSSNDLRGNSGTVMRLVNAKGKTLMAFMPMKRRRVRVINYSTNPAKHSRVKYENKSHYYDYKQGVLAFHIQILSDIGVLGF